jgi:hypothetical protein
MPNHTTAESLALYEAFKTLWSSRPAALFYERFKK